MIVRPRYALLTGTAVGITIFFAASYDNANIGRYYLGPILIAWTWIAILVATLIDAVLGAGRGPVTRSDRRVAPRRSWRSSPWSSCSSRPRWPSRPATRRSMRVARTTRGAWVDTALEVMARDAVVVSWWSYSTPLWYAQHVEGRRPDIWIVDDRTRLDEDLGDIYDVIDANLPDRPVYVIRDDPREIDELAARYELEPVMGPTARSLVRVIAPREVNA